MSSSADSLTFSVWGSGFRVQGSGFRVQGSGSRVRSADSLTCPPNPHVRTHTAIWSYSREDRTPLGTVRVRNRGVLYAPSQRLEGVGFRVQGSGLRADSLTISEST